MLTAGMLACWAVPVYAVVFLGLVFSSAAKTAYDPAVQAFIGRQVPFARRGLAIGVVETAWAGSTLVGIPVLALIIERFGLRWAFLFFALLGGLGWMMMSGAIPRREDRETDRTARPTVFSSLTKLIKVRPAAGMMGFGFWISMANDGLFVVYGAWLEQAFGVSLLALGASTRVIGAAELLGESLTAIFGDRVGLKRFVVIGLVMATIAYLLLPVIGKTLPAALGALFLIFFAFELTVVSSLGLSTEVLPTARATMVAGFFAAAGVGRMAGALSGGLLWSTMGLPAVALFSASATLIGLLSLLWGLRGWQAGPAEARRD
jgi:predicted MFS family arabinose efflux permease